MTVVCDFILIFGANLEILQCVHDYPKKTFFFFFSLLFLIFTQDDYRLVYTIYIIEKVGRHSQ